MTWILLLLNFALAQDKPEKVQQITETLTLAKYSQEFVDKNEKFFNFEKSTQVLVEPNQYVVFSYFFNQKIKQGSKKPVLWIYTYPTELKKYQLRLFDMKTGQQIYGRQPKRSQMHVFNLSMKGPQELQFELQNKDETPTSIVFAWYCQFCKDPLQPTEKSAQRIFEKISEVEQMSQGISFYDKFRQDQRKEELFNYSASII